MSHLLSTAILWLVMFTLGIYLEFPKEYLLTALVISQVYNALYILKGELMKEITNDSTDSE